MNNEVIGACSDGACAEFENRDFAVRAFELFRGFQARSLSAPYNWSLDTDSLQLEEDTIYFEMDAWDECVLESRLNEVLEIFKACGGLVRFYSGVAVKVGTDNNVAWCDELK